MNSQMVTRFAWTFPLLVKHGKTGHLQRSSPSVQIGLRRSLVSRYRDPQRGRHDDNHPKMNAAHNSMLAVALSFASILPTGCSARPHSRNDLISIWAAPTSTTQERKDAALALMPTGTGLGEAEKTLGKPTRRERLHGPTGYLPPEGTNRPAVGHSMDAWRLVYEFPHGDLVYLDFKISSEEGRKWRLIGAYASNANKISTVRFSEPPKKATAEGFE